MTAALAESPDAVVDSSLAGPAILVLKEVNKRKPGLLVIGGNGFNTPAIIASAGAAAEGAVSGTAWYLGNPLPENKDFVAATVHGYEDTLKSPSTGLAACASIVMPIYIIPTGIAARPTMSSSRKPCSTARRETATRSRTR